MTAIKERPILFSAPMVRAILEGRKTVTRRVVKVQPFDLSWSRRDHKFEYTSGRAENGDEIDGFWAYTTRSGGQWEAKSPFGQPGDRLWVRETFGLQVRHYGGGAGEHIVYRATNPDAIYCKSAEGQEYPVKWKPSIHMPRHSSRILLEITDVRVERLQNITEEQATAEGIAKNQNGGYHVEDGKHYFASPVDSFASLWSSVGGDWDANPWVWCVSFKRVTS